jgi:hypothetical protein
VAAPSPELVAFEARMRPYEFDARSEYATLMRRERAAGITGALTLDGLRSNR